VNGQDERYMAMALRLAERGMNTTRPNPRVGCVLVKDGEIVGEGWHERAGEPHAEIHALNQAGDKAKGAVAYVSLEPCCHQGRTGPCSQALIQAGVRRVVAAMLDPNPKVAGQGLAQLHQAGVETLHGLLQAQAEELNTGFIFRMRHGRPRITCKLAVSLDGHTAMANGESQWITSEPARLDVHMLRARSCAILTGVGTILSDDPSLTVRLPDWDPEFQPLRVIMDSQLQTPPNARCLALPGRTLILTLGAGSDKQRVLERAGAEIVALPADAQGRVDLSTAMSHLGRLEINELMVEAGAALNGALLESGLMDQCVIYVAPHFMGSQTRPMLETPALGTMADRVQLDIKEWRAVGRDWRITAVPEVEPKKNAMRN